MSRLKHSNEERETAVELYGKKGCNMRFLMNYYHVSYPVLRRWLEEGGVEIIDPGRWDIDVDYDKLFEYLDEGIGQREMARRLGVSRSVIRLRLADIKAGRVERSE